MKTVVWTDRTGLHRVDCDDEEAVFYAWMVVEASFRLRLRINLGPWIEDKAVVGAVVRLVPRTDEVKPKVVKRVYDYVEMAAKVDAGMKRPELAKVYGVPPGSMGAVWDRITKLLTAGLACAATE